MPQALTFEQLRAWYCNCTLFSLRAVPCCSQELAGLLFWGAPWLPYLSTWQEGTWLCPVCGWVIRTGSVLAWTRVALLLLLLASSSDALVWLLVSMPCILMKAIALFSPSLLGQDTLCLLCLFLSGLLVDPGLSWRCPLLLNGSGGCVVLCCAFSLGSAWAMLFYSWRVGVDKGGM